MSSDFCPGGIKRVILGAFRCRYRLGVRARTDHPSSRSDRIAADGPPAMSCAIVTRVVTSFVRAEEHRTFTDSNGPGYGG